MGYQEVRRERLLASFDEAAYLAANPDVAAAVASGAFTSGRHHYAQFGYAEGRSCYSPDLRRRNLLAGLDLASLQGLEIGPLNHPIVSRSAGKVLYIDHADTEALKRKYAPDPTIDISTIVPVDAVWGDKRLKDCVPDGFAADYVVAVHVVEHVPDLLGWLLELGEILTDAGQIRLIVPDRRYTFDILRAESRMADVLDAFARRARVPSPRMVADFVLSFRPVSAAEVWFRGLDPKALPPVHTVETALGMARRAAEGEYLDVHCWAFTPRSFAEVMRDLAAAGLLAYECNLYHDVLVGEIEFSVGLRRSTSRDDAVRSWQRMADAAVG